ncbi:lipopolysaccharide transport periplasmic protein LptA [Inhella gelatinilytica]|uniref:Lipopolysaccharide export system protein LptA n=1 Tax=Inhella gelatinilytica TaxID=2795030 RepID=A0A931NCH9_9BURK|nr:lipopolysaccharide transport periplasmic protein LptA [Inhella gelatinilytica]MBH9551584.1 lipopolysaccharide transport periplasmic protein LptA [Inhella gelatinilytica]
MRQTVMWLGLALTCLGAPVAEAAKDDRTKPIAIESERSGTYNDRSKRVEWEGPVLLTQGSLQLRAALLEVEERKDGSHHARALSKGGEPVRFAQALDAPGERLEGQADRIEYDSGNDTVNFVGGALVRRLKGAQLLSELTGATILYNSRTETVQVQAGQSSPHPQGRTRMVMMPRSAAASEAAPAASAVPLKSTPALPPVRR